MGLAQLRGDGPVDQAGARAREGPRLQTMTFGLHAGAVGLLAVSDTPLRLSKRAIWDPAEQYWGRA